MRTRNSRISGGKNLWLFSSGEGDLHNILVSSLPAPASSIASRLKVLTDRNSGIRATGILQYVAAVTGEILLHRFFNDHLERKDRNNLVYY